METTPTGHPGPAGVQRPPLRRGQPAPVAGVCLGLSRHLGVSVPLVRVTMILLTLAGGVGILLYLWLWIFVPSEREPTPEAAVRGLSGPAVGPVGPPKPTGTDDDAGTGRAKSLLDALTSSPEVLLGWLLLAVSALMVAQIIGVGIDWRLVLTPVVILIGVLLAWSQLDRAGPERIGRGEDGRPTAALWQVAAGAGLVLLAVLIIASGLVDTPDLAVGLTVAAMLLAGLALVVAPWLIKLYRTSQIERARAAAEAERADIAAHLHDSVLQTLAMIQKQRADPSAVERLARSQERQLRTWLYRQNAQATGTLKDQLLATAAELEEMHAVPVEVVTVGESQRSDHTPLVAAAREAILNAIKHAGPASVYVESNDREDAVFVRDRGEGFDVEAIDEDRLGVRESIIGRMHRAGGRAHIRSTGRGTEVQLFLPVEEPTSSATGESGGAEPGATEPGATEPGGGGSEQDHDVPEERAA
ncbi:ATP-binding protein [Nesterenkonia alba]|uniref:ATP-binding protein n=1 Tax=Nesterenkonia alba TaxID=515814 RepID=UPI0003B4867C|nr:ATP-binding protein [Nesterenkonia alba]